MSIKVKVKKGVSMHLENYKRFVTQCHTSSIRSSEEIPEIDVSVLRQNQFHDITLYLLSENYIILKCSRLKDNEIHDGT